jgi:hypothetical protein
VRHETLGCQFRDKPWTIALGAAAMVLGPAALAIAGSMARPIAKAGIKGGLMPCQCSKKVAEDAKESIAEITEQAEDEISAPAEPKRAKTDA